MSYIGNQPTQVAFQTDTFSGNGTTTAFTMAVAPATTTSVLVAITGVLQDPSTYSVVGTTLTFSAAPPVGTGNISVRYLGIPASGVVTTAYRTLTEFTATAGQTTFTPPSYTVGFINVYRNGALLGTADYTATNGTTVVLASAATSGDLVAVESFLVSSVLNAIPATAGSVGSTYLADGSVTTTKLADANLTQAKLAANVAGNGPAFSAYPSATQSLSTGSITKIQLNTEDFDTNSNYDTTLYRFQPSIAGYYQITLVCAVNSTVGIQPGIYKNGTIYVWGSFSASSNWSTASGLVYLNGSTDYVEGWLYVASAVSTQNFTSQKFQGVLVRAA